MRVSIQQVAEKAQVSTMTVSNVLRGRAKMSETTRQRVLEAVRELNYVPVRSTRQNTHIETRVIGLVPYHMDITLNQIDLQTYSGLYTESYRRGYDMLIMLRNDADWMANSSELRFLDRRCDGFVFISTGVGEWESVLDSLVEHNIPTVVCYRRDVPDEIAWVDPDNEQIIRLAFSHLVQNGHHKIVYLAAPHVDVQDEGRLARFERNSPNFDDMQRRQTFIELLRQRGESSPEEFVLQSMTPSWVLQPETLEKIQQLGATAAISNDFTILQLWQMAEANGMQVPRELSLVGIDNTPESKLKDLTTVSFAYSDIGKFALESCINLIGGGEVKNNRRVIPVELVERSSVASPSSGAA